MTIHDTGKYLSEDDNEMAKGLFKQITGPMSGMVFSDRNTANWEPGQKFPRLEGELYRKRFHQFVNNSAVKLGLSRAEEFTDEDGDAAINNYGLNFETREILLWVEDGVE